MYIDIYYQLKLFIHPLLYKSLKFFVLFFILHTNIIKEVEAETPDSLKNHRFGAFIGLNLNSHSADFRALPGVPSCCPIFQSGFGTGLAIGGIYEFPIIEPVSLQLRAFYSNQSALLKKEEETKLNLDGNKIDGKFEHTIDASLASILFQPLIDINLFEEFRISAGGSIGYKLTRNYSQQEKITEPADRGVFINTGTPIRNKNSGELQQATNIVYSIDLGLRYEFPLNTKGNLSIAPEFFISFGLSSIVDDVNWRMNTYRIGASIYYMPESSRKTEEKPAPDKMKLRDYKLPDEKPVAINLENNEFGYKPTSNTDSLSSKDNTKNNEKSFNKSENIPEVTAFGVVDGKEYPQAIMEIEEFLSINMRPLLNYVFFDENSSVLPERYSKILPQDTGDYHVNKLFSVSTIETYRQILNIIAKRMRLNSASKITLTGCNSNTEGEFDNLKLSLNRAESVASYLENTWGIEKNRIILKSVNLPDIPSRNDEADGIEENRRVEINSDDYNILSPVITNDTLREVRPPVIRFYPKYRNSDSIKSWRLAAIQNGITLKEYTGNDSLPKSIEWKINEEQETVPRFDMPVTFHLEIIIGKGDTLRSKNGYLPINQRTILRKREEKTTDKKIDRYSLILFEFDEYKLNNINQKIADFIKGKLEPNSKLKITGYTDRFGESEYNRLLSARRAVEVSTALKSPGAKTLGFGESVLIFDNDTPEGRFYCRTVEIIVETPIKW
ncbi:MAG: hypothetical protein QG635_1998 [Bacteroidota bacterium]|nr:hypothetical protein [Bacteroidota bacterium]